MSYSLQCYNSYDVQANRISYTLCTHKIVSVIYYISATVLQQLGWTGRISRVPLQSSNLHSSIFVPLCIFPAAICSLPMSMVVSDSVFNYYGRKLKAFTTLIFVIFIVVKRDKNNFTTTEH